MHVVEREESLTRILNAACIACSLNRHIVQQYVLPHDILLNYLAYKTTNNIPIQDGSSKVQVLPS